MQVNLFNSLKKFLAAWNILSRICCGIALDIPAGFSIPPIATACPWKGILKGTDLEMILKNIRHCPLWISHNEVCYGEGLYLTPKYWIWVSNKVSGPKLHQVIYENVRQTSLKPFNFKWFALHFHKCPNLMVAQKSYFETQNQYLRVI